MINKSALPVLCMHVILHHISACSDPSSLGGADGLLTGSVDDLQQAMWSRDKYLESEASPLVALELFLFPGVNYSSGSLLKNEQNCVHTRATIWGRGVTFGA